MPIDETFQVVPIAYVRSTLKDRKGAPRQGHEGAPDAWLDVRSEYADCLDGIEPGSDVWIFTWLHEADRSTQKVHPRGEVDNPIKGVFATRSPDRPNPIGLHRATVLQIADGPRIEVQGLEAIDGTPVIDIKPALECKSER